MNDELYEVNVKRLIQSTEHQLKKLSECITRSREFQQYEDWGNVKKAHVNASQIIHKIKADIQEIEKVREEVVSQLEDKSSNMVVNKIDEQLKDVTRRLKRETMQIESLSAPYISFVPKDPTAFMENNYLGPEMFQMQVQRNEFLSKDYELCDSYDSLQKDCDDLKNLMEAFSNEIFKQKISLDSLEKNSLAHNNSGTGNLAVSLKYKTLTAATSGALLGTIVAGPIGLLAGAKLGAVVGLGSGFVGFLVTKFYNRSS